MNKSEVTKLMDTVRGNSEFLEKIENVIPVITVAEKQEILDGISKGLDRLDNVVVLTGVLSNILPDPVAECVYKTGALIICSDIDCSSVKKVIGENKGDIVPVIDLHVDVKGIENLSRIIKQKNVKENRDKSVSEVMVELLAQTIELNKELEASIKELHVGNKKSIEEIEKSIYEMLVSSSCDWEVHDN